MFEKELREFIRKEIESYKSESRYENIEATKVTEGFVSRKEAASYLGCSIATIDNMVRYRRLEKYKMGRSTKFKKCDLDNLPR